MGWVSPDHNPYPDIFVAGSVEWSTFQCRCSFPLLDWPPGVTIENFEFSTFFEQELMHFYNTGAWKNVLFSNFMIHTHSFKRSPQPPFKMFRFRWLVWRQKVPPPSPFRSDQKKKLSGESTLLWHYVLLFWEMIVPSLQRKGLKRTSASVRPLPFLVHTAPLLLHTIFSAFPQSTLHLFLMLRSHISPYVTLSLLS